MYVLLTEQNIVKELIPDKHPAFPDAPIEERYPADFVAALLHVDDSTEVAQNMVYDPETGVFSAPVIEEPEIEPELEGEVAAE